MVKRKIVELASAAPKPNEKPFDSLDFMEKIVAESMLDLQNQSIVQHATKREFRTSGLPFCPILDFLRVPQSEDYKKSHYTSTGTAIHETIQSWMSLSKVASRIMYGSWKCTGCKRKLINQMKPTKLCECDIKISTTEFHRRWPKHWTYEEVEYNYDGLSGHIDLILIPRPDFAFVMDFKTTELEKKKKRFGYKQDKTSSPNYIAQIRTYSTILTLEHKLPIKGWCLVNTERGKPITGLKDFHMQVGEWGDKQTKKWDRVLKHSIKNNKQLTRLEKAVDDGKKVTAKKVLQEIIEQRPCHSPADYDAYMKYKFFSGTCEFLEICTNCKDKVVYNAVISDLAKRD